MTRGSSVPMVGAVVRGEPPKPGRAPVERAATRARWPGFLLMALGLAGLGGVVWAMRDGAAVGWSKAAMAALGQGIGGMPWGAAVAADLARLTRPTLLWLLGAVVVLGAGGRGGVAGAIGLAVLLGVTGLVGAELAGEAGRGRWFGVLAGPEGGLLAAFLVVMLWGYLFGVMRAGVVWGVLVGVAAGTARVAVGEASPVEAVAGASAAVAVLGALRWLAPGGR